MIDERFVLLAALINFIGTLSYLTATIKGQTKPNKVTWFLWALAPLIAFSAQMQEGVGLPALMTFMVGFSPLLIFLASFINKSSVWKITKFDILCGTFSLLGLFFWILTQTSTIAILFSILADAFAGIPTIVKAYKNPETENATVFLLAGTGSLITLLTIKTWTFAYFGFPVYIFLICTILFGLIHFKLGKVLAKILK